MYFDLQYGGYYYHDINIKSLTKLYNDDLRNYLPTEFNEIDINNIKVDLIEEAVEEWRSERDYNTTHCPFQRYKNQILSGTIVLEELEELYADYNFFKDLRNRVQKHPDSSLLIDQLIVIYDAVVDYNYDQFTELFELVERLLPFEYSILIDKKTKLLFRSNDANRWFIETIEEEFDLRNGTVRNFNAFLKAIIDNSDVKNYIFSETTTQKNIVEYVNKYYGKQIIKNPDRLSNPYKRTDHIKYIVSEFIKEYRLK